MACFLKTFCLKQLGLGVQRVEDVRLNIFGPLHDIVPTSLKRVMGVTRVRRVQRWGEGVRMVEDSGFALRVGCGGVRRGEITRGQCL